ncbi:related to proline oxidase [Fusarium mangiferae]|uniref:Proline dehydrogenase n=1 Tax=Fusarium mangiferae TaxID=192010 RepID=A0A1L7TTC5_FUSMA|nr:uncharacterized protein FMAN_08349 [Fusarium mangiferae]CVK98955.1 related to proline oxidase [Fusarium mangiferae]
MSLIARQSLLQVTTPRVIGAALTSYQHHRFWMHSSELKSAISHHQRTNAIGERPIVLPNTKSTTIEPKTTPLCILPLGMIIRSLLITSIYSSAILQNSSLRILWIIAHAESTLLSHDKNPILKFLLKKTFYAQFCAGETPAEVQSTVTNLKNIGFAGVILSHAKEAAGKEEEAKAATTHDLSEETAHDVTTEIQPWVDSVVETIKMTEPNDYVALKFSGAGRLALYNLSQNIGPSPYLSKSIHDICTLARQRRAHLLIDAEHDCLQEGVDKWTMIYARSHNTSVDTATIYGTYQAYRKVTPATISRHLAEAQEGGFTLGVKLVRGAYLDSDPRHCFHDTKAETDDYYNTISSAIITRQWGPVVDGNGEFPNVHMVLATHNTESVSQARIICDAGKTKTGVVFAQLQGMADEVGCELIQYNSGRNSVALPAYKYVVWGNLADCMKYLLRRAYENRDAIQRTERGRKVMWAELIRRCKMALSFSV